MIKWVLIYPRKVNDMNFRVHLQLEFQTLGLEKVLKQLKGTNSDKIKEQLKAFEDNMMDVSILAEDANAKLQSEQQVTNLYNRVDDLTAAIQG